MMDSRARRWFDKLTTSGVQLLNNMSKSPETEKPPRIVVIGVGNLLLKDEGVGIHVVQALQEIGLPPDVRLIDGGTSPDLIAYTRAGDKMVIVDAARAGGEPGTVYRFLPADFAAEKSVLASAHEMGVVENLTLMSLSGNQPRETIIIGVEPAEIDWGTELSPVLRGKLPDIIKAVLSEIGPTAGDMDNASDEGYNLT
jgi:hydrogenase maturation protease